MSDKKIEGVKTCSNHGCVFGHPGGMGTNGQCHCLDIRPLEDRIRATRNVLALRAALTAERERADRAEHDCNGLSLDVQTLKADRDALRERVARLESQNAALLSRVNAFYSGNPEGGIVKRLEAELTDERERADRAETVILSQQMRFDEVVKNRDDLRHELTSLRERVARLEALILHETGQDKDGLMPHEPREALLILRRTALEGK